MSWGVKIACLYTGFALLIATMVSLTARENIDLVTPDYYEQELKFQERIDAVDRTNLLKEQLTWELKENSLHLHFPQEFYGKAVSGTVYFFRPSDKRLDVTVAVPELEQGKTTIPLHALRKGMYKMQVSWQADKVDYFKEGVIQIQ